VTGTKTFSGGSPFVCYQDSGSVVASEVPTTHQATIHTSHGVYGDNGTASTSLIESSGTAAFGETFTSSQTRPTLIAPTSKDQCKNGGVQGLPTVRESRSVRGLRGEHPARRLVQLGIDTLVL